MYRYCKVSIHNKLNKNSNTSSSISMDKSIHDGSYPPRIKSLLSINQLIIRSPLLILFLILGISITKPSYAVSSSILDKLLSNYCISKKGSSICSSDEEAQFLRDGTNRCKCGGWKYWSRGNRLCSDCPIDSIRNEDNLDSCKKIICPAGSVGRIIHNGKCPSGSILRNNTAYKSCPMGFRTYSFK